MMNVKMRKLQSGDSTDIIKKTELHAGDMAFTLL
jgi:hypothetical protein